MKKTILCILSLFTIIHAQVVVKGVSPSSIAGVNYNFTWADPGGGDWTTPDFNLPNTFVQDSLELVVDNSHEGDNPAYAIPHPLANEGCLTTDGQQYIQPSLDGKIAVVWRGSCQFGVKAALAENNGAVGIIIINHSGDPVGMAGGDSGTSIGIPVVMLSTIDGQALLSLMDDSNIEPSDTTLLSISPSSALAGQNLNVTITGQNTNFGDNTSLSFSFEQTSSSVNSIEIINNNILKANITVPENASEGNYDVVTTSDVDGELSLSQAFSIISASTPPSLVSVTPSFAQPGETLDVSITGENTHFLQGSSSISLSFSFDQGSPTSVNSLNIIDDLTIEANITVPVSTPSGSYNITVSNDIDEDLILESSFTVSNNENSNMVEMFMGNKQNSSSNDVGSSRDVANGPKYGSIPLEMANNGYTFDLGLTVTNFGTDDIVPIINQTVSGPSGDIYSDLLNLGILPSGNSIDTLYQTYSGAEFELGEYIIDYNISIENEIDQDPSDNLISSSFNVTENILSLARTDENTGKIVVNSYPRNAETDYTACIRLQDDLAYEDPAIEGMHFSIQKADSSVEAEYVQVQIFEWNDPWASIGGAWANVTFNELDLIMEQDYICPDDSLNGKMVYVPFEDENGGQMNLQVSDNQRYLVCLQTLNPEVAFGYDNALSYSSNFVYYDQPVTAINIDGTWYSGWTSYDALSVGLQLTEYVDYTGINSNVVNNGLLYPNPANSEFNLYLPDVNGQAEITLHDLSGKIVKVYNVNNMEAKSSYDISDINSGHYYVNVKHENGTMNKFNIVVIK